VGPQFKGSNYGTSLSCAHFPFSMQVLDVIMALENPKAKQLGCMIMAASNRIDQLWSKCTPTVLLDWLSKTQATITDKIDVLKTVRMSRCRHVANTCCYCTTIYH
jgi:hypothetical protein